MTEPCTRCPDLIEDDDIPHVDPDPFYEGASCHERCCRYCHIELRDEWEMDLPSAADERYAASQRPSARSLDDMTILGHGVLDAEQTARAQVTK